ncbi:MAG TPA: 30S ribosomal protein S4 [Candidatus Saccharimonadales bacterium]|nr:30S ribosomal protein S4 [Candidatus Saccharimonadales bacterium]
MARYRGPVCRLCRREGLKLFLKGDRCFKPSCAIEKRGYAPGQHGNRRVRKIEGYGIQLREKQKVKRIYGVLERQFRRYFGEAARSRGITGEALLLILEKRLDTMVYRFGFASSRAKARQMITHGHVLVDGRKVDIPGYQVRQGQAVSLKETLRKNEGVKVSMDTARGRGLPSWLSVDPTNFTGSVLSLPRREDLVMPIQEQLIVELYSK